MKGGAAQYFTDSPGGLLLLKSVHFCLPLTAAFVMHKIEINIKIEIISNCENIQRHFNRNHLNSQMTILKQGKKHLNLHVIVLIVYLKPKCLTWATFTFIESSLTEYVTFPDLSNLRGHHLVSWLRMRDMSVMTVGGLVFSSDPRVQVTVVESIMEAGLSVYQLEVTNVTRGDRGQYQCQVILASDWSTDCITGLSLVNVARSTQTRTGVSHWCSRL